MSSNRNFVGSSGKGFSPWQRETGAGNSPLWLLRFLPLDTAVWIRDVCKTANSRTEAHMLRLPGGGGGEETWVPAGIVGEPDHPSGLPASRLVFNQRCCYYLLLLSVLPQQSLTDDEVSLIFGRPQNNFFQLCGYKIRTLQVLRQCIRSPQELMLPLGAPQREKKHHLAIERFFCWFVQRLLAHAMGIKLIWKLPFRWMIWR